MRDIDELRPLRLGRLLELWQACRECGDGLERVLLCNGRILSECCFFQGERVYASGAEVLSDLTGRQMERMLRQLAEGGGKKLPPSPGDREVANPAFDAARFEALQGE